MGTSRGPYKQELSVRTHVRVADRLRSKSSRGRGSCTIRWSRRSFNMPAFPLGAYLDACAPFTVRGSSSMPMRWLKPPSAPIAQKQSQATDPGGSAAG